MFFIAFKMKITLILIGKTDSNYLQKGIDIYVDRLKHYIPFTHTLIPALKSTKKMSIEQQKQKEGELIIAKIKTSDFVVLLDENGKKYSSEDFASFVEKKMIAGIRSMVFVVGGPYGFSNEVYQKCDAKVSLSDMTFSHQMVRLIFVEQLYRAMTIINGEPYHHQ